MSIKKKIAQCLLADQRKLTKKGYAARALKEPERSKALETLESMIAQSMEVVQARSQSLRLSYPDLPVSQAKERILKALSEHQVLLIAGDTGSGKSTQLAKMCLEAGRGVLGWVGHTQPRRLAARTVADRVAQELGQSLGQTVSYKVRFSEKVSMQSRIKVMTDGILLNEMHYDPWLLNYDTLIIDEAHERSLNIDLLLGTIKTLIRKREDLKVIITSATIALEKFSDFFDNAPMICVEGKAYPVELHYLPKAEDEDYFTHIMRGVESALHGTQGDVLVFLSGEGEIHQAQKVLKFLSSRVELVPLYARLSLQDQRKVYQPSSKRRVILSTNVAETSLTVPNISAVVDPGFARVSRYSYRSKIQRLPIEPVAQSSCRQRMGRAGRVREGQCWRLYSQEDFDTRAEYTEPEIQRTNLASVILRMSMLKLTDIETFPFLDAPDTRYIRDGIKQLERLEALDKERRLTPMGKKMAQLPIEPKLARVLIQAEPLNCLKEMLIIVSGLSIQDPREYPKHSLEKAQSLHAQYYHPKSNFMELLKLWEALKQAQSELSASQFRKHCHKNMIHPLRWFEWLDVHRQLSSHCKDLKCRVNTLEADYESIHKALLSGFFETVGRLSEENTMYEGARGIKFLVPKQKLKKKPTWVMASDLVETKGVFASRVAQIEPGWLEEVAKHCCQYQVNELTWDARAGFVKALSQVTFFGLMIHPRKPTPIKEAGPEALKIFVQEALIEQGMPQFEFYRHNQKVIQYLKELEQRCRRPDSLFDRESLEEFYLKRLPDDIYSVTALNSFVKKSEQTLKITLQDVSLRDDLSSIEELYPSAYHVEGLKLQLSYVFDLDSQEDGVTLHVPAAALQSLRHHDFSWAVPGLVEDKLEWYLTRIGKNYRRQLGSMRECLAQIPSLLDRSLPFPEALIRTLRQHYKIPLTHSELNAISLPLYAQLRFEVSDDETVVHARDFSQILENMSEHLSDRESAHVEKHSLKSWSFGDLPISKKATMAGHVMTLYPALVDQQDSVSLDTFTDQVQAQHVHLWGVVRLMMLVDSKNGRELFKNIPQKDTLKKQAHQLLGEPRLLDDLIRLCYHFCCLSQKELPRTQVEFEQALNQGKPKLNQVIAKLSKIMLESIQAYQDLKWQLIKVRREKGQLVNSSLEDIEEQLQDFFQQGFILSTPIEWLLRYPVYLQAIKLRLERLLSQPQAEQGKVQEIRTFVKEFKRLCSGSMSPSCQRVRWAIEEYRIILFAQPLKTKISVSNKKLRQWFKEII